MKSSTRKAARRWPARAVLCGSALALLTVSPLPAVAGVGAANCGLEPGPQRSVAEVLDGETLRLDDGKILRLMGILAPRAFDAGAAPGTWLPETRARQGLAALVSGRTVTLAFAGPRTDRYGRVRAHVDVGEGAMRTWVQGALVADGFVRSHPEPGGAACAEALIALERAANSGGHGLWSEAAYHIRAAERPSELLRYRGTYQLVMGRVTWMRRTGGVSILELASIEAREAGRSRRAASGAIRVTWRRADVALAPEWTGSGTVGVEVLVRGWIVGGHGPEIRLVAPAQLALRNGGQGAPTK